MQGLQDYERGPYKETEKLGFRAADRLHRSPYEIDDEFYAELRRAYTEAQIIELICTAAAFEFFTRFVDVLRIPTTPVPVVAERKA